MIDLPNDAWRGVISYLPPHAIYQLGLTCKKLQQLANVSPLWKYFCTRDFGGYSSNPFRTFLRCKKYDWKLVREISCGGNINFLDFRNSQIISGNQPVDHQSIKFYKNHKIISSTTLKTTSHVHSIIHNNDLFITGTNQIDIWDLDGENIHQLKGHTNSVTTLIMEKGKLISGSFDQTILIWDIEKQASRSLKDYKSIRCLSLFDNELISGGGSGNGEENLHLWDLRTKQYAAVFDSHDNILHSIQRRGYEITLNHGKVWDIRTCRLINKYPNFNFQEFAPDGGKFLGFNSQLLYRYVNNQIKFLFKSPNYLTCIKRLGDRLLLGSTTNSNEKSIYLFELSHDTSK